MGRQKEILEKLAQTFQIRHVLIRQGLAECLGTLVLVVSKEKFFFCASCWLPRVSVCLKEQVGDRAKNKNYYVSEWMLLFSPPTSKLK